MMFAFFSFMYIPLNVVTCIVTLDCVWVKDLRPFPLTLKLLLQVMGFGLFLIDGKEVNANRLDGKRRVNMGKIDKIFKVCLTVHIIMSRLKSCRHSYGLDCLL